MNIARPCAVGLDHQHRHEANNWCVSFIDSRCFRAVADFQAKIDIFSDFFLQNVRGFVSGAIIFD